MWFFGHDLSLGWRIAWIDNGFSCPCHFWDSHGVVVSFLCFMVGSHVSFSLG